MTATRMVELTEAYLELKGVKLERTKILLFLNNAYRYVVSRLEPHYLNPLQVLEENLPLDSDGWYDLGNLSNTIREKHRGIIMVRYDGSRPASLMSEAEMRDVFDKTTTPGADHPCYFSWGDKIQCWPHSSLTDVDSGDLVVGTTYYNLGYTTVTYNGSDYTDTQSFVAVAGVLVYTTTGTGIVAAGPQLIDIYYIKAITDMNLTSSDSAFDDRVNEIICKIACGAANPDEYQLGLALLKEYNSEAPATDSNKTGVGPIDDYYGYRGDPPPDRFNITIST